ncbi:hypothetical protein ATL51_2041 [Pseudonocardia alni]|uniref:Uncharacterized protein n=1 Tax=Pseudonocardia alni TaxID=33907 RepID=A0AA44ZNW7_PSEA5|nr:hypothetical protein ATL51_2041 [Pseudonocardia alni]
MSHSTIGAGLPCDRHRSGWSAFMGVTSWLETRGSALTPLRIR